MIEACGLSSRITSGRASVLGRLAARHDVIAVDLPWVRVRSGSSPVATGRSGSATHSLHEPGYSAASIPASSRARTVWAAVIPDPQ